MSARAVSKTEEGIETDNKEPDRRIEETLDRLSKDSSSVNSTSCEIKLQTTSFTTLPNQGEKFSTFKSPEERSITIDTAKKSERIRKQNTIASDVFELYKLPDGNSVDGDKLFYRVRTLSNNVDVHQSNLEQNINRSVSKVEGSDSKSESDILNDGHSTLGSSRVTSSDGESRGGTSSGVGTSLVSVSGFGTSRDGTGERNDFISGYKARDSGTDFWNQVIQQVSFIDSSGGSARSSLLLNCSHQIPPGVSRPYLSF